MNINSATKINDEIQTFYNSNAETAYPILFNKYSELMNSLLFSDEKTVKNVFKKFIQFNGIFFLKLNYENDKIKDILRAALHHKPENLSVFDDILEINEYWGEFTKSLRQFPHMKYELPNHECFNFIRKIVIKLINIFYTRDFNVKEILISYV